MPWCDRCSRYYTPPSVPPEGTCPHCGAPLTSPAARRRVGEGGDGDDVPPPRPPWHFWLMVLAVAAYLGWRAVQGIVWLVDRL